MAGYIGSKAVTLSTTAADVAGNAVIDGDLTVKGTTVTIDSAAVQEIRLGDNDKLTFGDATGGDLQIYHDGSHSVIKDAGDGNLQLIANDFQLRNGADNANMMTGASGGAITLMHNGSSKLATTSTGVDITGTLTSDGLTVGGSDFANTTYTGSSVNLTGVYTGLTSDGGFAVNVRDSGYLQFSTSNTERMRIDSSGNVGIGTSSPAATLSVHQSDAGLAHDVQGTSGVYTRLGTSTTSLYTVHSTTDTHIYTQESAALRFGTAAIERMRIDSSGNVGIGDTSPGQKLSVDGNMILGNPSSTGKIFYFASSSGYSPRLQESSNNLLIATNNTERLRVRNDGIVSINDTTDPTSGGFAPKLHIKQSADGVFSAFTIEDDGSDRVGGFGWGDSGEQFSIGTSYRATGGYKPISFITNGSERMRVAGGNITNTGSSGLPSAGLAGFGVQGQTIYTSATTTATRNHHIFYNSNGAVGSINTSGSSTIYNTSSDYRLKENVTDVSDGIARVKQLAPKRFNFIADPDTTVDGFIAHEAQTVVPEAVTGAHNETKAIGDITDGFGNTVETGVFEPETLDEGYTWTETGIQPVYQGIDQSKLVPLLTAALQEAIAKIETLETEMTSVKARLDALEGN